MSDISIIYMAFYHIQTQLYMIKYSSIFVDVLTLLFACGNKIPRVNIPNIGPLNIPNREIVI